MPGFTTNETVTDRLLEFRSKAKDDARMHARYHELVRRYQRLLARAYRLKSERQAA